MSNRRQLARERLEIYLVHILLAYRLLIRAAGLLLLIYALVMLFVNLTLGCACLLPAIYLVLLGSSYNIVVYTARAGAWAATVGRKI